MGERAGTHGGAFQAINVSGERPSANCRVEDPVTVSTQVITQERPITNGSVIVAVNICKKRRIAESVVAASVNVVKERKSTKSVVAVGKSGSARVIIIERKAADSIVVAGDGVEDERISSNGRVATAAEVEDHRCSANCGILARPGTAVEGQRSSTNTGVEAGVTG